MAVCDPYVLVDAFLEVRRPHVSRATWVESRLTLRRFIRTIDAGLDVVAPADIERWLWSMRRLSPGTRRLRFSQVRVWFRWLAEHDHLVADPFVKVSPPTVPRRAKRALGAGQAALLLSVCPDERARCVVLLGLQLGLRRAEIAGLEIADVDLAGRTLLVRHGKGGHQRLLPLTADAGRAISDYLAVSPCQAGPLVRGDRYPTAPVAPHWVGLLVSRLCWEAGIKTRIYDGVSSHALRHTAACDVFDRTKDVLAVRDLLGHDSLESTQIYLRGLSVERLRAAVEGRHYG